MDLWMYVLGYLLMTAVTGRLIYRYGDFGLVKAYNEKYDKYGFKEKVFTGYYENRLSEDAMAWASLAYGLIWPLLLFVFAVKLGNTTSVDRHNKSKRIEKERDISLREREARVLELEKELGINR